jgi:hypothetical protein
VLEYVRVKKKGPIDLQYARSKPQGLAYQRRLCAYEEERVDHVVFVPVVEVEGYDEIYVCFHVSGEYGVQRCFQGVLGRRFAGPEGLGDTVIRGGLYAVEPRTGRAVASPVLAGLLNSNVWRSRSAQENAGELRPVIYDVVRYRGEPFADKPYDDKLRVLREVTSKVPSMTLPPMAETASAKRKLLEQIRSGELGDTREGVVMWNRVSAAPPTKAKFRETHDVYVRGFFPGSGKYAGRAVGGFTYSHTPDGPVVGRCGTGLSDAQRIDMHDKPDAYLGLVATVQAHEKFPSEALRVPAFDGWHLDKNPQPRLDAVIH